MAGETVEARLLAEVSSLPHPARVVAVFRRDDLPRGYRSAVLALWRVADPGNVGTLLRAADAFGASIALSPGCADVTSPKALRASAGAVFRVPSADFADAPGRRIALVRRGGTPLSEAALDEPLVFLLGSERDGLPDELVTQNLAVTIPQLGGDSLNVAMAGTIALYELARRSFSRASA